jgi:hypothetical protein
MAGTILRLAAPALLIPLPARAEIEIILRNSFIEKYKNRATINTDFLVDKAHKKPNAPSKDGDLHIAGRPSSQVGLVSVAELMNASLDPQSVQAIHDAEALGQKIAFEGVWRIWCEHGGTPTKSRALP